MNIEKTQIDNLVANFADAVNQRDIKKFESLWIAEGVWEIEPPFNVRAEQIDRISSTFSRLLDGWEFFIQIAHHGVVEINGDRATARWYMTEVGRNTEGEGFQKYGVYRDRLVKQDNTWLFAQRTYHFTYIERPSLTGQTFSLQLQ